MKTIPLFLTLTALPLTSVHAQEVHWARGGFIYPSAVDLSVDVTGDGLADAIIGDKAYSRVVIYSGTGGTIVHNLIGDLSEHIGTQVVGVPDLNGDGFDEFGFCGDAGGLHLHDGQTGAELYAVDSWGVETRLESIGDVNGDGYGDVATSYPTITGGQVWVHSGRYIVNRTQPEFLWVKHGLLNGRFGQAIASIGDVDGDGFNDIAVGAPLEEGVVGLYAFKGQIHCLSGATGDTIWTKGFVSTERTYFGNSLAAAGDINGDGVGDVLVGAPGNDSGGVDAGAVFVLNGVNGWYLEQLYHSVPHDNLGTDVASAGDIDGDGIPDHLLGAGGSTTNVARARLYSGASMSLLATIDGAGLGRLGTMSGGVDATGDGVADFLLSSPGGAGPKVELWRGPCEGGHAAFCTSIPNSSGMAATLDVSGSHSISSDNLTLEARRCPPGKSGVFFFGTHSLQEPFGDGFRCAGGSVARLRPIVTTDGTGTARLSLDFSAFPVGQGPMMIEPGDVRYFQYWFRDPMGPSGSGYNLTNGQRVTFCH